MHAAAAALLKGLYPMYRPILSQLGLIQYMARMHPTDKGLHGYLKYYRRHFAPLRRRRLKLLEIGIGGYETIGGGGSLRIWKDFFPRGEIYGLDLHDKRHLACPRVTILQGDQNDPAFLDDMARRYGPFDIIIDDGSHFNEHIITSFTALFPHVTPDGFYVVEDLYHSYRPPFGGSTTEFNNDRQTANAMLKSLVDDMHYKYIPGYQTRRYGDSITEVCFYRKICFIQKGNNAEPDPYFLKHGNPADRQEASSEPSASGEQVAAARSA